MQLLLLSLSCSLQQSSRSAGAAWLERKAMSDGMQMQPSDEKRRLDPWSLWMAQQRRFANPELELKRPLGR